MDIAIRILSRWLHVIAAVVVVGGVFFMRVILPLAAAELEEAGRGRLIGRCRNVFKRVVHTGILLLTLTGAYNSVALLRAIRANPVLHSHLGLLHGLWGMHMLCGLAAFVISLIVLAGQAPKPRHRSLTTANLILLLAVILLASALKQVRDSYLLKATTPAAVEVSR